MSCFSAVKKLKPPKKRKTKKKRPQSILKTKSGNMTKEKQLYNKDFYPITQNLIIHRERESNIGHKNREK